MSQRGTPQLSPTKARWTWPGCRWLSSVPATLLQQASRREPGLGHHYEELPRLASLTCTRPASISWRIASARLERRRSKRKSSICSTRLRGKEIVVTHAGGRSAFSNMAMRPRDSKREATAKRGRPAPRGRQREGLAGQPSGARCGAPAWGPPPPCGGGDTWEIQGVPRFAGA
jgi:hypothetical protein